MGIYVAIPTYNRKGKLDTCLTCFDLQETPPELVVVCHATSTDGTEEMLADKHPNVVTLRCTDDNWWTGTINVCIREILTRCKPDDYILCINDDVEFNPDYLTKMLAAVEKSPKRAVGSAAVDMDNPDLIEDGGNLFNWITAKFTRLHTGLRISSFAPDYEQRVNIISGRGVIYPARVFRELGLFAPALLSLHADYEFSARCERAGYELVVSYGAPVRNEAKPTSLHQRRGPISPHSLIDYYTNPRSSANLRERTVFAWLTRRNLMQFCIFYAFQQTRVAWRYLRGPDSPKSGPAQERAR